MLPGIDWTLASGPVHLTMVCVVVVAAVDDGDDDRAVCHGYDRGPEPGPELVVCLVRAGDGCLAQHTVTLILVPESVGSYGGEWTPLDLSAGWN